MGTPDADGQTNIEAIDRVPAPKPDLPFVLAEHASNMAPAEKRAD